MLTGNAYQISLFVTWTVEHAEMLGTAWLSDSTSMAVSQATAKVTTGM
jgi:hypothetical protein